MTTYTTYATAPVAASITATPAGEHVYMTDYMVVKRTPVDGGFNGVLQIWVETTADRLFRVDSEFLCECGEYRWAARTVWEVMCDERDPEIGILQAVRRGLRVEVVNCVLPPAVALEVESIAGALEVGSIELRPVEGGWFGLKALLPNA